jgi:zinc transport system permease protein
MMGLAVAIGAVLTTSGLALSYAPDLPAGPTIIVLAGAVYLVSTLVRHGLRRRPARRGA